MHRRFNRYRGFDTRNAIEVAWHILRLDKLTTGDIRRLSGYTDIISKLDNPRIIEYHTAWKNMDRHEVVIITETTAAGSLRTYAPVLFCFVDMCVPLSSCLADC